MDIKDIKTPNFDPQRLYPRVDDSSEIAVFCRPNQYSASEICRAVEDCDAHVLNLNVSADMTSTGEITVYLRVNRLHVAPVLRSIERFGYTAELISSADDGANEDMDRARDRANELLHYLEI